MSKQETVLEQKRVTASQLFDDVFQKLFANHKAIEFKFLKPIYVLAGEGGGDECKGPHDYYNQYDNAHVLEIDGRRWAIGLCKHIETLAVELQTKIPTYDLSRRDFVPLFEACKGQSNGLLAVDEYSESFYERFECLAIPTFSRFGKGLVEPFKQEYHLLEYQNYPSVTLLVPKERGAHTYDENPWLFVSAIEDVLKSSVKNGQKK